MSGIELTVILFGLFLGYWLVSRFIGGGQPPASADRAPASADTATPPSPPPPATPAWHEVLGVDANANSDDIRRAYKVLMSQYHPDKVATLGEELRQLAERKSQQINAAYREALQQRGEDA